MRRLALLAFFAGSLVALAGCGQPPTPTQPAAAPVIAAPPAPASPPPPVVTAARLTDMTFIYNHSLVDGSLEGPSVVLKADGKLTGADEQTGWRLDDGVLVFTDANGAVRTRFDKAYSGRAGLFFLGHRTSDNKYHTLLELPPTK